MVFEEFIGDFEVKVVFAEPYMPNDMCLFGRLTKEDGGFIRLEGRFGDVHFIDVKNIVKVEKRGRT